MIRAEAEEVQAHMAAELEFARMFQRTRVAQAEQAQAEAKDYQQRVEDLEVRLARSIEANRDLTLKLAEARQQGDKIRADAAAAQSRMASELESAHDDVRARTAQLARTEAAVQQNQNHADLLESKLARVRAHAAEQSHALSSQLSDARGQLAASESEAQAARAPRRPGARLAPCATGRCLARAGVSRRRR